VFEEGDLGFSIAAHGMDVRERSGHDLMRARVKVEELKLGWNVQRTPQNENVMISLLNSTPERGLLNI
jgi:hypothetical protein